MEQNKRLSTVTRFAILLIMLSVCLSACFKEEITYSWYDADGVLLYEETLKEDEVPTDYPLPADSDKWDYYKWDTTGTYNEIPTEKTARRVPQASYFAGNVFQIVVQSLGEQPIKTGSAFVFNSDGWFVTNAHVMEDGYYAQAIFNIPNQSTGESYTYFDINNGTYYHADKDLYIGKIDNYSKIKPYYKDIPFNQEYAIGDLTYSVGYPNSSAELVIDKGEITEKWSDIYEKLYSGHTYICSSSYIAPGSSGGILVNENLEVLGITTLGWTNYADEFISGASISAFNFASILDNTNTRNLQSLQTRFHKDEKVYIGYYNEAKNDATIGKAEKVIMDDGAVAYVYEWQDEGVNDDGWAYSSTETLCVCDDGWISYESEYFWDTGGRRTISFYGFYDNKKQLSDFIYEFRYDWEDGSYITVECYDINYSENLALTLNKCVAKSGNPSKYSVSDENITYAKEQFNYIYEWLIDDISRFR